MPLEGTIKDFGLADILQMIGIQRKTGILALDNGEDTVTVKFLEGQVVGADTRRRTLEDLLGAVLVRTGRITGEQLQEALRTQRSTLQRLGYILVRNGSISEEDLREALRIQVTQIVYRLFRWRDGSYHFDPMEHVEYDDENFAPVSAETILMEGARMVDEWPIIERRIRSGQAVFCKTKTGAALERPVQSLVDADIDLGFRERAGTSEPEAEIQLSADEREVLRMVDGGTPVQEIAERCPIGEFDTYRILYDLLNRNLIEEVRSPAVLEALPAKGLGALVSRCGLPAAVLALAALSAATLAFNPATPWRLEGRGEAAARLKGFASRARLERVEQAVRAFYLDLGAMPARLDALGTAGYLSDRDLLDPWGRAYAFDLHADGYRIAGSDEPGGPSGESSVVHRFTAAQRMLLQGGPTGAASRRP